MEKVKKPIYKKWWFWVIIVVVVFAIAAGGSGSDKRIRERILLPVQSRRITKTQRQRT